MGSDQYARDLLARRDKTIAEARAQIAVLREALENALGPTAAWAAHYQLAYETDDLHPDHQKLLDEIQAALSAPPSDCYAQIRAEILDEAFAALPEENFKFVDRDKIKAVFEKLKVEKKR